MASITGLVSTTLGAPASLGKRAAVLPPASGLCPASVQFRVGVPFFVEHYVCSRRLPSTITSELQRWERKKVKDNSLPTRETLHVKVGDTVQVISGADKKKVGEVVRIYTHNSKILVKNINFKTKHVKGKAEGESGQIVQVEAPIHSSNVMLYSKEKKVASRVGNKTLEDGQKVRFLLKTGEVLDTPEDWKRIYKKEKKDKK